MLDREKVLAILRKRFQAASDAERAAAANALLGLEDEWEEVIDDSERRAAISIREEGPLPATELRIFRRRHVRA